MAVGIGVVLKSRLALGGLPLGEAGTERAGREGRAGDRES